MKNFQISVGTIVFLFTESHSGQRIIRQNHRQQSRLGVCGSVSERWVGFLQQGSVVDVREEQKYIPTVGRQTKTSEGILKKNTI